ncbi:MAG: 7-cyano-7-deazaguanine synthase [Myxococcales bacterium]|nr:7-cyano-7-deazaguanine synthase [Myxococcales bacterium]
MVRQLAADGAPARFERSRGRLWICGDAQKSAEGEGGEAILVAEGFVAQGEQRLEEIVGRATAQPPEGHFVLAEARLGRGELSLVRSISGGERLYYARVGEVLIFGSSVRHVLAHPELGRELDAAICDEVILNGHPVVGACSPFVGVEEVPPGHVVTVRGGERPPERRWLWRDRLRSPQGAPEQLAREFADALRASIARAVGRRRPVAVALSGGIDSSAIAAAAADVVGADQLVALSYEFDDPTHPRETQYAEMVCRALGIRDHRVFKIGREEFLAAIPEHVWRSENPVHWPKAFMLPVARRIRDEGFDLYLTGFGIGSHMLFMRELAALMQLPVLPRLLAPLWRVAVLGRDPRFAELARIHPALEPPHPRLYDTLLRIFEREGLIADARAYYPLAWAPLLRRRRALGAEDPYVAEQGTLAERLQRQAFKHLISCVDVTRSEKSSREAGLYRVSPAHFAATLPYAYFPIEPLPPLWSAARRQRPGKYLLQLAFRGVLPDEVLFRKKSWADAVASPTWLRAGRRMMLRAVPRFPDIGVDDSAAYRAALLDWEPRSILASSLSFAFWRRLFVERALEPRPPTWPELHST